MAVYHSPYGGRVLAEDGLLASGQIKPNPIIIVRAFVLPADKIYDSNPPENLPIHAGAERLVVAPAETDVQHRRAVFKCLY